MQQVPHLYIAILIKIAIELWVILTFYSSVISSCKASNAGKNQTRNQRALLKSSRAEGKLTHTINVSAKLDMYLSLTSYMYVRLDLEQCTHTANDLRICTVHILSLICHEILIW